MDLALACNTREGKIVTLHPESADKLEAAIEGGFPVFAVDSGDGSFVFDPADPSKFTVMSGAAAGVTVVSVRGHSVGNPDVVDTVTLTVDLAAPILADFGLMDGGTVTK